VVETYHYVVKLSTIDYGLLFVSRFMFHHCMK